MLLISRTKQLFQIVALPVRTVRAWLTPSILRQVWRVLTLVSLLFVGAGLVYAWHELPAGVLSVSPVYLALAIAVYVVTYVMHTLGWHTLASHFFGELPLRDNVEAVAASNLVKYLPTIAWYIANRASFYHQRQVSHKLVVAASLCELAVMIGVGTVFYLLVQLVPYSLVLAFLVLIGAGLLLLSAIRPNGMVRQKVRDRLDIHRLPEIPRTKGLYWLHVLIWYGGTWPIGVFFLWCAVHVFVPVQLSDLYVLANVWLVAGLASYAVSLSFGSLGIAREITLTMLLAQYWPFPVAVATSIIVKMVLTLGEIGCSGIALGWLHFTRKQSERE